MARLSSMAEDTCKAYNEWIESFKEKRTRDRYISGWKTWLRYCELKGIPKDADSQLVDMKKRRLLTDETEKWFYDNEIPKLYVWLTTEYKRKDRHDKPMSESGALAIVTAVRSFFSYHRYPLDVKKGKLPSSEEVKPITIDHAYDIYQLRDVFQQGDLRERTVLSCGKDLWMRIGDFRKISRELIETLIKREDEIAKNENREPNSIEFEIITEKEKEPQCCHLSKESIELLRQYLKVTPKETYLFPLSEDALNDILKRLSEKAKITLTGRVHWHCLRKFGITIAHGIVQEPVWKYMTGKHIEKSTREYIQTNREPYKAFKLLEPKISLTRMNGNGASKLMEDYKTETFKRMALEKLIEKILPMEQKARILMELAEEYGIKAEDIQKEIEVKEGFPSARKTRTQLITIEDFVTLLAKKIEKQELQSILEENGSNNH